MYPKIKRIILHVGPPKTGTSILQSTLAKNRRSLSKDGFLYPKIFPKSDASDTVSYNHADLVKHDGISLLALPNPGQTLVAKRYGLRGRRLKRWIEDAQLSLRGQMEESTATCMILSSESLGNFAIANGHYYPDLAKFLYSIADEIRVILYARHPVAMLRSRYQHYIRVGIATMEELNQKPWYFPYEEKVSQLRNAFGSKMVEVRCYRRDFDSDFDIVQDFSQEIGFAGNELKTCSLSSNESVSMEGALLMDVLSEEFPQPDAMKKKTHPKRGGIPRNITGAAFQLDPGLEALTMRKSERDLGFLNEEYGIEFPKIDRADCANLWGSSTIRSIALAFNQQTLRVRSLKARVKVLEKQLRQRDRQLRGKM